MPENFEKHSASEQKSIPQQEPMIEIKSETELASAVEMPEDLIEPEGKKSKWEIVKREVEVEAVGENYCHHFQTDSVDKQKKAIYLLVAIKSLITFIKF